MFSSCTPRYFKMIILSVVVLFHVETTAPFSIPEFLVVEHRYKVVYLVVCVSEKMSMSLNDLLCLCWEPCNLRLYWWWRQVVEAGSALIVLQDVWYWYECIFEKIHDVNAYLKRLLEVLVYFELPQSSVDINKNKNKV